MRNGRSDDDDVWESLRLTGVAVVSAVIGAGGAVLPALLDEPDAAPVVRVSAGR